MVASDSQLNNRNSHEVENNHHNTDEYEVGGNIENEFAVPLLTKEEEVVELADNRKGITICNRRYPIGTLIRFFLVIAMVLILLIVFILTIIPNSPILEQVENVLLWIEGIPVYGKVICVLLLYCVSAPFSFPISPINLASGFLFHFWWGCVVSLLGCAMGSIICYVWGKTLLYSWSINQMNKKKILRALALAVNTKAIRLIILTHLSPILPASMIHYFYAAIGVPFGKFIVGTVLGVSPFLLVYVYIGSISRNLTSALSGDDRSSLLMNIAWIIFVIVGSVIILGIVTWFGKRELNKALQILDQLELQESEAALSSNDGSDSNVPENSIDFPEYSDQSVIS